MAVRGQALGDNLRLQVSHPEVGSAHTARAGTSLILRGRTQLRLVQYLCKCSIHFLSFAKIISGKVGHFLVILFGGYSFEALQLGVYGEEENFSSLSSLGKTTS